MRYLYQRGNGALRRVVHLCGYDPVTGCPTMQPLCGHTYGLDLNTTSNVPWGRPTCKLCRKAAS